MTSIQKDLFNLQDPEYKQFHCRLIPTVEPDKVIGVRMPALRKYAKTFKGKENLFMQSLPHKYYEEYNLHGILLCQNTDIDETVVALDRFLPYVDNWATCDLLAPKAFSSHPDTLIPKVLHWLDSNHPYTVRFSIGVLLRYYLDEAFRPQYLAFVAKIRSNENYVNMMISWYFATALAKQYDASVLYLQQNKLDRWCHNKAIQKAIESYRITSEQKEYLRTLKIK